MNSQVYVCKKPVYTEERKGRYLLIWDDIPNWMVVDEEAYAFIEAIQGVTTVEEITEKFQSITTAPFFFLFFSTCVNVSILVMRSRSIEKFLLRNFFHF